MIVVHYCSAFRHEMGVGNKYIGIDKLAATFTKLGHRLSAQNKEFIIANFSVQDEREKEVALAEIRRLNPPTNSARPVTPGVSMTIEERRKKLLIGRGAVESSKPGYHSNAAPPTDAIAIDYMAFCDEIYPCDWV